jgi:peptide deformylase
MALLTILHYPDPRLQKVAAPIHQVDDEVRRLAADMAETMYDAPGIGLAATQVDVHRRLIVIDISEAHDQLITLINPRIVDLSADLQECEEGCLSVPGIYDEVERPARVEVEALGLDGKPFRLKADGLAGGLCPARDGSSGRHRFRRSSVPVEAQPDREQAAQAAAEGCLVPLSSGAFRPVLERATAESPDRAPIRCEWSLQVPPLLPRQPWRRWPMPAIRSSAC